MSVGSWADAADTRATQANMSLVKGAILPGRLEIRVAGSAGVAGKGIDNLQLLTSTSFSCAEIRGSGCEDRSFAIVKMRSR